MAIFARKYVQRMLDENSVFLSPDQLIGHVNKLNREDLASLDTEWEVAVLNAFSKLGTIRHEENFGGPTRLDLHFTPDGDPKSEFLADIRSVSDDGFEDTNPVKFFYNELQQRLRKADLSGGGFYLSIGSHPIGWNENPKLMLPPKGEMHTEFFNAKFKKFLEQVKEAPEQPALYHVATRKTKVELNYAPGREAFVSNYAVYNQAKAIDKNPIYSALKKKHQQLRSSGYSGIRGIILCDGGTDMPHANPHSAWDFSFNAQDAIFEFMRQNSSLDFVCLITAVWTNKRTFDEGPSRSVDVTTYWNESFPKIPESIKQCLLNLDAHFPEPENTATGARETIRGGYNPRTFVTLGGGFTFDGDGISISANSVLALLAGHISQDEFFRALGMKPSTKEIENTSMFGWAIKEGLRISEVEIKERPTDDTDLLFKFERDPGVLPFRVPEMP